MDSATNLESESNSRDLSLKKDDMKMESEINNESEPTNKKLKLSDDVKTQTHSSESDHKETCSVLNKESNASFPNEECAPSTSKSKDCKFTVAKIDKCKPTSKNKDTDEEFDEDDMPEPPEEGFVYPIEMDSSDMLDEVEFEEFPTVTDRYLTPYYQLDVQKPCDDVCVRIHSNRVCMISLAPSHIIFQENKTIVSCNYKVSEKLDRLCNKVSGKAKHGAQPLQSNSNLCCLTCSDGSSYMIKCCMIGKLLEVNKDLVENPELLKLEPHFGGYIALVLPNLKHLDKLKDKLLTREQYEEAIKKRMEKNEIETKTAEEKAEVKEKDLQNVVTENTVKPKECFINMETGECEDQDNEKPKNNDSVVKKEDSNAVITSMEVV